MKNQTIEESQNTITSPLTLRWDDVTSQYKVSKPNDQSGEYVDKKIADELVKQIDNLRVSVILALEFGYKQCEKGNNLTMAFLNLDELKKNQNKINHKQ